MNTICSFFSETIEDNLKSVKFQRRHIFSTLLSILFLSPQPVWRLLVTPFPRMDD